MEDRWPRDAKEDQIRHRLLSALACNGEQQIICHCAYFDPQCRAQDDAILYSLSLRIQATSNTIHLIAGDWQGAIARSAFGVTLQASGWLAHSRLHSSDHVTNRPLRGEPRLLDDMFLSPNIAKSCVDAKTEWVPGWSTRALLMMACTVEQRSLQGQFLMPGLARDKVQEPQDADPSASVAGMVAPIQSRELCPGPITAADLQATALSRADSAAGMDSIPLCVLQALPEAAWIQLAFIFNMIEESGVWP